MAISALQLHQFRPFTSLSLDFKPGCNFLVGHNGCGKTSVLEALYFCAYGKSFRSNQSKHIIQRDTSCLQAAVRLDYDGASCVIKSQYEPNKTNKPLIDDMPATVQDCAKCLPIVFMDTSTHRDFASSPKIRRAFLNWCCFYTFPQHADTLQKYSRALLQRNHFLKQSGHHARQDIQTWNDPLLYYAGLIDQDRVTMTEFLNEALSIVWEHLGTPFPADVALSYHKGWSKEKAFAESLEESLASDLQHGYTHLGPHRADLRCKLSSGGSIFDFFSQGQQKLFTYALKFAQQKVLEKHHARNAIVIIDDLPAELDAKTRQHILAFMQDHAYQAILSGLHVRDFGSTPPGHVIELANSCVPCETFSLDTTEAGS